MSDNLSKTFCLTICVDNVEICSATGLNWSDIVTLVSVYRFKNCEIIIFEEN